MKINVDQVLLNGEGKPRKNIVPKVGNDGLPITAANGQEYVLESKGDLKLSDVLIPAINGTYRGEEPAPDMLYERGRLVRRIRHGGERSFTAKDVTLINSLMVKRYPGDPELVVTVAELLDPELVGKDSEPADTPQ